MPRRLLYQGLDLQAELADPDEPGQPGYECENQIMESCCAVGVVSDSAAQLLELWDELKRAIVSRQNQLPDLVSRFSQKLDTHGDVIDELDRQDDRLMEVSDRHFDHLRKLNTPCEQQKRGPKPPFSSAAQE